MAFNVVNVIFQQGIVCGLLYAHPHDKHTTNLGHLSDGYYHPREDAQVSTMGGRRLAAEIAPSLQRFHNSHMLFGLPSEKSGTGESLGISTGTAVASAFDTQTTVDIVDPSRSEDLERNGLCLRQLGHLPTVTAYFSSSLAEELNQLI